MQSVALRVAKLIKQKQSHRRSPWGGGGGCVSNWTVHKYFSRLNITNSDSTTQTPMANEFRYNPVMDQYIYFCLYHKMER